MFCRFMTFSDGALYYEVGSTTCGLTGTYLKTFFMNFNKILQTMWNAYFSCSKQTFYIIRIPISYSRALACVIFKYTCTSLYYFFMATKVNRSTKSDFFYKFSKNHNKKTDNQKKRFSKPMPSYLIISIS